MKMYIVLEHGCYTMQPACQVCSRRSGMGYIMIVMMIIQCQYVEVLTAPTWSESTALLQFIYPTIHHGWYQDVQIRALMEGCRSCRGSRLKTRLGNSWALHNIGLNTRVASPILSCQAMHDDLSSCQVIQKHDPFFISCISSLHDNLWLKPQSKEQPLSGPENILVVDTWQQKISRSWQYPSTVQMCLKGQPAACASSQEHVSASDIAELLKSKAQGLYCKTLQMDTGI